MRSIYVVEEFLPFLGTKGKWVTRYSLNRKRNVLRYLIACKNVCPENKYRIVTYREVKQ